MASVGYLADAVRNSQRWKQVPLCVVKKSVQELIHAGMLQAVNKLPGPGLQVRLGAAVQEVGEVLLKRAFDGPLF